MKNKKLSSFTLSKEMIDKLNILSQKTGLKKSTIIDRLLQQTTIENFLK
jgi:predicted DNA-binding protein